MKTVSFEIDLEYAIQILRRSVTTDPLSLLKDNVQEAVVSLLGMNKAITLHLEPTEAVSLFSASAGIYSKNDIFTSICDKIQVAIVVAIDAALMNEWKYGVYSAGADEMFGHKIYLDENGEEVKVTAVYSSIDLIDKQYGWNDKHVVGRVRQMVKSVCPAGFVR